MFDLNFQSMTKKLSYLDQNELKQFLTQHLHSRENDKLIEMTNKI